VLPGHIASRRNNTSTDYYKQNSLYNKDKKISLAFDWPFWVIDPTECHYCIFNQREWYNRECDNSYQENLRYCSKFPEIPNCQEQAWNEYSQCIERVEYRAQKYCRNIGIC
jgi:hypothetical protein